MLVVEQDVRGRFAMSQTQGSGWGSTQGTPPGGSPDPGWNAPPSGQPGYPTKYCHACSSVIDARAQVCPRCGVQQGSSAYGNGKSRPLAIVLALFLGNFGVHRFYLGDMAIGFIYLLFFWTGIPGLIAWAESLYFLTRSNEDWARQHGGAVDSPSGCAMGCLWILALLPFLAIGLVVFLIFLGGGIELVLSAIEADL
jgi:TM2 domain-containing membrane protein YozV